MLFGNDVIKLKIKPSAALGKMAELAAEPSALSDEFKQFAASHRILTKRQTLSRSEKEELSLSSILRSFPLGDNFRVSTFQNR